MNGHASVHLPPGGKAATDNWSTPAELYAALDSEFRFTMDPCPLDASVLAGAGLWGRDGLLLSWAGERVFCNPPYSDVGKWLEKGRTAALAVYLLPARTDTAWFQRHAPRADAVRFLRGRIRFGDHRGRAPFPSVVLVFDNASPALTLAGVA